MDSDLIARAVRAGLELAECKACPGLTGMCPACGNSRLDTSDGAMLMAVCMAPGALVGVGRGTVSVSLAPVCRARSVSHDNTPAGIAAAAAGAFCRAVEART